MKFMHTTVWLVGFPELEPVISGTTKPRAVKAVRMDQHFVLESHGPGAVDWSRPPRVNLSGNPGDYIVQLPGGKLCVCTEAELHEHFDIHENL